MLFRSSSSNEIMLRNTLENGTSQGAHRKTRGSTPPPRRAAEPRESKTYEHSYSTVDEWLKFSKNKGTLVEEIYKRPGWQKLLGVAHMYSSKESPNKTGEFRKHLLKLKPTDLAEILITLDSK